MRKIISIILALVVVICICESAPIKIVANAEEKINLWDGYIPISTKEDLNNIRYADFDNGQPKYYLTSPFPAPKPWLLTTAFCLWVSTGQDRMTLQAAERSAPPTENP